MRILDAHSVFHHNADPNKLDELRAGVIDDISFLHSRYPDVGKISATDLSSDDLMRLSERYRRLLHYGHFSLSGKRKVANELIWKWTEASGKYVGCQFWSLKAKKLFDLEVADCGGWPITMKAARHLESKLSKKSRPKDSRLTHEHVYPIEDMKSWLRNQGKLNRDEIRNHFERQCVGCVVLESEHDRKHGDDQNPWLRYNIAGITLAQNSAWLDAQRVLIDEVGLIESSKLCF